MNWPFLARKRTPADRYQLDHPLADCPGCWKARAVALYWVSATCRDCHRVHRARWLPVRSPRR